MEIAGAWTGKVSDAWEMSLGERAIFNRQWWARMDARLAAAKARRKDAYEALVHADRGVRDYLYKGYLRAEAQVRAIEEEP